MNNLLLRKCGFNLTLFLFHQEIEAALNGYLHGKKNDKKAADGQGQVDVNILTAQHAG